MGGGVPFKKVWEDWKVVHLENSNFDKNSIKQFL